MGLMDKQTQQAFALGGLNDEGGEIDEVSGNRVPIGGTKEGVRDDIDINISEGEFVFPADVVRYHGLDKMMALRQEAKMGLKQMERMGQMGNSDKATMPDDLPFEMADLIVVGGKGEPMKFANGGFVPEMQTLETAPVPTMGGGTSTGTQTPIVYDDFMKTPVVTMQEYRDANGNSIIITSVNGKATTEIPAGYTLYVPPTNAAPTATQAAIQTANNYSYQTSGGDEGPDTPRELQVDPDYASMDNSTLFSTINEQNSFGAKAGKTAATGIALMMGPFGLASIAMINADARNLEELGYARYAAMPNGPEKKAYAKILTDVYGQTTVDPKEENALVKFGKGFATAVSGLFGLGNDDAEKVARTAGKAVASNNSIAVAEQAPTAVKQAPTATPLQVEGMGSPLSSVEAPERTPAELTLNQSDAMQTRDQAQIALDKVSAMEAAKAIAPAESTMDIMGGVGTKFNPAPPTGTSNVVTQQPPMQSNDANVTTTPKIETTAKPARPKPGESTLEVAQQTQRPLTIPSGGMDDTAAIQAGMKPVAQAAGTPTAGYDRQPVNRAEFERNARGTVDFFGSTEQFKARELLAEAYADENIFPGGTYDLEIDLINRYGFEQLQNAGLLNEGQIYDRPSLLKDGSFRPDKIEDSEILADGITPLSRSIKGVGTREAGKSQVYFDGSMYPKTISPVMTPSPQPSPAIERPVTQTDALLGPQTEYGRRIASAKGDNFIPQSNVDVAGLSDYVPASIKRAVTSRVAPTFNEGAIQAQGLLERQALKDSPDMFGPQLPTTPSADPVVPASTGYGNLIPSERTSDFRGSMDVKDYRGSAFPNLADTRQGIPINYVEPVSQPSLAPMATSPSFGTRQRAVGEGFDQTDPRETINPDPMNDSRQAFADNRVYSSPREEADKRELSDSQLTLGKARNAMPDPYTDALFDSYAKPSVKDQTANAFNIATGTVGGYDEVGTIIDNIDIRAPELPTTPISTMTPEEASRMSVKEFNKQSAKAKIKPSDAASTSKGTRKAAPTGDDRRSDPNFLERAFGITPAKISARRGNDGVLYRTQADKREADNRQLQSEQVRMGGERYNAVRNRPAGQTAKQARLEYNARPENAKYISTKHGGDKEPSSKIVCSAMNNAYGFGSFRNKIWLEHSKNNLTKEHQVGYHRMFLPLIHLGYNKDYKFIRKCLEHIARHRTADIYFQSKSNKRDTLGMVYRTILEPICYLVGMFPTSKDNK